MLAILRASKTDLTNVKRDGINNADLGCFGISFTPGVEGCQTCGGLETEPAVLGALDA